MNKISVIVPVLNGAGTIGRLLDSVFSQGYKNFELLVCDGGSTDGTLGILKDRGITPVSFLDEGPDDAPNKGYAMSTGDIICIIGSDDEYLPGAFEKIAESLDKTKEEWAYAPMDLVQDGQVAMTMGEEEPTAERMSRGMCVPGVSAFYTRKLIERFGFVDQSFRFASDYEFCYRLIYNGVNPRRIDKKLVQYHITGKNLGMSQEASIQANRVKEKYRA